MKLRRLFVSAPKLFSAARDCLSLAAIGMTAGCSSSSAAIVAGNDAGTSGDGGNETISFQVDEYEAKTTPISGALVSLDYADGQSELQMSDATGTVKFTSSSIASGVTVLSGGISGRIITTLIAPDLTKIVSNGLQLTLSTAPTTTATLSGAVSDKIVAADRLLLTATIGGATSDTSDATYSLSLPTGAPFTLVGVEHALAAQTGRNNVYAASKWFHLDHDALSGSSTLDIDVGAQSADVTTQVTGTIQIPSNAGTFGSTCHGGIVVYGIDSTGSHFTPMIGSYTSTTLSSDQTSFGYAASYLTLATVKPYTVAELYLSDGTSTQHLLEGAPTDAFVWSNLLVPITFAKSSIAPGDTVDGSSSTDTIYLAGYEGTAAVWTVVMPAGKVSTIPQLRAELKALLGSTTVTGALQICRYVTDDPSISNFCTDATYSRTLTINP